MRVVLCYHAITPSWRHPLATTPAAFRRHIHLLAARGYTGVTFTEIARGTAPRRAAAITFDDAFASVPETARPILDEVGWPATVFVVTDAVDDAAPMRWLDGEAPNRELAPLSWAAAAALRECGWEIGSHSRTHALLSALSDDELREELVGSRAAVERRCGGCSSISYPWGEVDARVVAAARKAGYTGGSGLAGRFVRGDPMRVPRLAVAGGDGPLRFGLKTSGTLKVFRSSRAWDLLDAIRRPGRPLGVRPSREPDSGVEDA